MDYNSSQPVSRARVQADISKLPMHRNIIDYEGDLARKGLLVDNAQLTPAALFSLRSNPNFIVASRQSREKLQSADDFRYALSIDMFFSAMGAGQVYHAFAPRKQAKTEIEKYLTEGVASAGGIITGNAVVSTGRAREMPSGIAEVQRKIYTRKINSSRDAGAISEAASYAEDAVSLFPGDGDFQYQAGALHLMQGQRQEAQPHIDAVALAARESAGRREPYARLLLRAGEYAEVEKLIAEYPELHKAMAKNRVEFDALMQLRSLAEGNLNLLHGPFPWDTSQNTDHTGLITGIENKMSNDLLKNEICSAATQAMEFRLVANSCRNATRADRPLQAERMRITRWVSGAASSQNSTSQQQIFADHAMDLLNGGFTTDALVYSQRVLSQHDASTTSNLLALSLLRTLSLRKSTPADSKVIADQLTAFGISAATKTANAQAKIFYGLLADTTAVLSLGAAALRPAATQTIESSGVLAARNLLLHLALSVKPVSGFFPQVLASGLAVQSSTERDLAQHLRTIASADSVVRCPQGSCSLLIKHYLSAGNYDLALQLLLESQGFKADLRFKNNILPGLFGFAELFPAEIYRWNFDGNRVIFESIPETAMQEGLSAPAQSRYLLYDAKAGPLAQRKLHAGRDAVLVTTVNSNWVNATKEKAHDVSFASPSNETLYASFIAKWGNAQKLGKATIVVKPPFHQAGGMLQIYSDGIALSSLPKIKPAGYHLFCDTTENYAGFAAFAHTMVEKMQTKHMSVEDAYFEAFTSLKGKQASTRPLYYLYRN